MPISHTATILTDLTFGDAGKGTITDALARRHNAGLVVRYNGGAQASHTVVEAAGRSHAFRQFGSGTFVEGCETFLSRHMLVEPIALMDEAFALQKLGVSDAWERVYVDARALVTTPYHRILNQLRELSRGSERHGSCGMGIGETVADALASPDDVLRFGDLLSGACLRRKLGPHCERKRRQVERLMPGLAKASGPDAAKIASLLGQLHSDDEWHATIEVFAAVAARVRVTAPDFLAAHMGGPGTTLFEGAQGVLLDEDWGFHPYTTWSRTTPANARALIAETGLPVPTTVLGLTRAYQTRHGAGPFPTESETLTRTLDEPHNPTNAWQGPFRAGWLDLALLRYAIQVSGPLDGLVMTHLDRIPELPEGKVGVGYAIDGAAWSLIPENPGCLEQREADGKTLASATVRYESLPSDANVYAATVAEWLGLPLWGTSSGPTAREKWFVL